MLTNKKVVEHFNLIISSLEEQWKKRHSKTDPFTHVWIVKSDSKTEKIPDDFLKLMFGSDHGKDDFATILKEYVKDKHPQGLIFCMEAWTACDINEDLLPRHFHAAKDKAAAMTRCVRDAGGAKAFGSLYGRAVEVLYLTAEDDEGGSSSVMYEIQKDGSLVRNKEINDNFTISGRFSGFFDPET